MGLHDYPKGRQVTFYHSSADASTAKQLEVYVANGEFAGQRMGLGRRTKLALDMTVLSIAATGDAYLFADIADVAIPVAGVSTSAETFTVLGDYTDAIKAGDTFAVYGSTGNDAKWTVLSVAYNPGSGTGGVGTTVITVTGNVTNSTADGSIALRYFDILAATSASDTFEIAGDYRSLFRVGRTFKVDGSTGNDNSGTAYTVTAISYSSTTNRTTISVASSPGVADETADGRIIPQAVVLSGTYLWRGDPADDTQVGLGFPTEIELAPGFGVYLVAAAGSIDVTGEGWYRVGVDN
ncbi:MAG: hypothetical protein IT442_05065 [Phycisphaeraceae bacterium]|nr:hypothetical protein [Phycisphaeraceae bacterium]